MTTKEAITLFKYYLQSNHKKKTIASYDLILDRLMAIYAQKPLADISSDEIFHFLIPVSLGVGVGIGFLGSIATVRKHLHV